MSIAPYDIGSNTIEGACTGPDTGLKAIRRSRTHLSLGDDIDFIDTANEEVDERKSAPKPDFNSRYRYQQQLRQRFFESNNTQNAADQNANKNSISQQIRPRKLSKSEIHQTKEQTLHIHQMKTEQNTGGTVNIIVRTIKTTQPINDNDTALNGSLKPRPTSDTFNKNFDISKENIMPNDNSNSSSDKMELLNDNDISASKILNCNTTVTSPDEFAGVSNWNSENDNAYGLSVSLYEKNYITQESTGNPIADCYGLISRRNSIAMALSDGVNWGKFE